MAGKGIPKIHANGYEKRLLQENVALTSQNKAEVSPAL